MVKFHKRKLIVCNEAEAFGAIDPIGSISIINWTLSEDGLNLTTTEKKILFSSLNETSEQMRARGVRIFPNKTVDQDIEPEYITVIGGKAYITLQEQNSIAVIDLKTDTLEAIKPLGYIAISDEGNSMDTNDGDKVYLPRNFSNVFGMFMPDTIKSFRHNRVHYLVPANEGDARTEASRIVSNTIRLKLNTAVFDVAFIAGAGRLEVSNIDGFNTTTGFYDKLYSYGTRSFSIWNAETMELVFDSGNDFELKTYEKYGNGSFNANHNDNNVNTTGDSRSDNKGPEPEALAIGTINGYRYAFIGLERMCGIMVYDITKPLAVEFVTYFSNRNFTVLANSPDAGDLGPEGLEFIPAGLFNSFPMLLSSNEVSGTTSLYKIDINRLKKRKNKPDKVPICKYKRPVTGPIQYLP